MGMFKRKEKVIKEKVMVLPDVIHMAASGQLDQAGVLKDFLNSIFNLKNQLGITSHRLGKARENTKKIIRTAKIHKEQNKLLNAEVDRLKLRVTELEQKQG